MDLKINLDSLKNLENNSNLKVDAIKFQKMLLLFKELIKYHHHHLQNLELEACILYLKSFTNLSL